MGGKDAIVVADDADLDSAASGIVSAAFGFQGQKCSACSRLIVDEKVHDELMEKVVALTKTLKVGLPTEGDTNVAAVINKRSFDTTLDYIKKGIDEGGVVLAGGKGDDSKGFYIEPTIIDNVEAGATIEQEEIFAPVLAVIKARDFDHALEIANDTEFGLTGAVYSTDQGNLEKARREFHVGNLYLNRKCTGASGRCSSFWRLQHERHRFEGRRPRVFAAIHARQDGLSKSLSIEYEISQNIFAPCDSDRFVGHVHFCAEGETKTGRRNRGRSFLP